MTDPRAAARRVDDEHAAQVRALHVERARPVPERRAERAELVVAALLRDLIAALDEAFHTRPMHPPDPQIRAEMEARVMGDDDVPGVQ